jgi:AcrR family transcriptional regulator
MAPERTGGGDARLTLRLLWRSPAPASRGPKAGLSVDRIVAAGVALADRDGLDALSMRRVAQELGVGTMSLYRHVPGKAELLDLMFDRVLGETLGKPRPQGDWRERLRAIAWESWRVYHAHPWMLQISQARPPLGPNVLDSYEQLLQVVDGIGLEPGEMDAAVTLVSDFVAGAARRSIDSLTAEAQSGQSDESWWDEHSSFWEEQFTEERYPTMTKLWQANAFERSAEDSFGLGVERILDGIAARLGPDATGGP